MKSEFTQLHLLIFCANLIIYLGNIEENESKGRSCHTACVIVG